MRSLKDISGENGNSDPYLRQCYYIIILCIAVLSEQDIVFSFLAIMALFDCEIPITRLVPSLTSDKLYNITLLYLYFSVKPETLHNQECTKIKIRTTCKMLEKLFWVLYKKLTHALLTEFLKVGSDDAL